MAAWVLDIFCDFYKVKNHKTADNSTTTKAREKISTDLEPVKSKQNLMSVWLNLNTIKFYLIKLATDF